MRYDVLEGRELRKSDSVLSLDKDFLNLAFMTDPHFSTQTPSSRKDDYAFTMLDKLSSLRESLIDLSVDVLLIGGDIFNVKDIPYYYISAIAGEFKKFQDKGVLILAIAGNHDIYFSKKETLSRTPTGLLFSILDIWFHEYLIKLSNFQIKIVGIDYEPELLIPKTQKDELDYHFLICHEFLKSQWREIDGVIINYDTLPDLGWDIIFFGHDHVPYPTIIRKGLSSVATSHYEKGQQGVLIVRPGSLSRRTSHVFNLDREKVGFSYLKINKDFIDESFVEIKSQPPSVVFDLNALSDRQVQKEIKSSVSAFVEDISKNNVGSNEIYNYLDNLSIEGKIKNLIKSYLKDVGI